MSRLLLPERGLWLPRQRILQPEMWERPLPHEPSWHELRAMTPLLPSIAFGLRTIVRTQSAVTAGTTAAAASLQSAAMATTAGNFNLVVVTVRSSGTTTQVNVATVADTAVNTYHLAKRDQNAKQYSTEIWYCFNSLGNAANKVTVTPTGSSLASPAYSIAFTYLEFSGVQTAADPLDATAGSDGTSLAADSLASGSTLMGGELIVGVVTATTTTFSAQSFGSNDLGRTDEAAVAATNSTNQAKEQVSWMVSVAPSTTYDFTATLAASQTWHALVSTFKPAPFGRAGLRQAGGSPYTVKRAAWK